MGRESRCFFTGHRVLPQHELPAIRVRLEREINKMISKGITTFVCGGAMGFDMLAAQTVLSLREGDSRIKLILALPCRDQATKWRVADAVKQYNGILSLADCVVYVSDEYDRGCMHKRNRYMATHAQYCIAYRTHFHGGSDYTVKYAQEIGCDITFIADVPEEMRWSVDKFNNEDA